MWVKEITLKNFRNVKEEKVSFSPKMTFLLGENAQGKTNVIEAIYLFARGKSFRGAKDIEMCAFEKEEYLLSLTYEKKDREETLSYGVKGKEKIRKRNGIDINKQTEFIGHFLAVLFCPDHLQMVKGSPSERRKFLDVAIAKCYPVYLSYYSGYIKNLEERNALLKAMQKGFIRDGEMLTVYSEKLAFFAAKINRYRKEYLKRITEKAKDILDRLSGGKESLSIVYQCDTQKDTEKEEETYEEYKRIFSCSVDKEIAAGVTLYGVQKDELLIYLGGRLARDFASQGQQRSIVLALKMAEGMVIKEVCGEMPVYLFDDVLSELDEGRRRFLLSGMENCQIIFSGCEEILIDEIKEKVKVIRVKNGILSE